MSNEFFYWSTLLCAIFLPLLAIFIGLSGDYQGAVETGVLGMIFIPLNRYWAEQIR